MMKKRLAALLMAATMGFVSIPVHASEQPTVSVEQAEGITVETVADIEPVDEGKFAVGIEPYALSDWKKIRSYTYTIEFEDKISNLTISAITSLIKVKYIMYVGAASSIASMVKAAYKKPDLKGKKAFYAKNTVYGYTYQSGREATKRIALDAKKRTIKGTETYSDVAIKGK